MGGKWTSIAAAAAVLLSVVHGALAGSSAGAPDDGSSGAGDATTKSDPSLHRDPGFVISLAASCLACGLGGCICIVCAPRIACCRLPQQDRVVSRRFRERYGLELQPEAAPPGGAEGAAGQRGALRMRFSGAVAAIPEQRLRVLPAGRLAEGETELAYELQLMFRPHAIEDEAFTQGTQPRRRSSVASYADAQAAAAAFAADDAKSPTPQAQRTEQRGHKGPRGLAFGSAVVSVHPDDEVEMEWVTAQASAPSEAVPLWRAMDTESWRGAYFEVVVVSKGASGEFAVGWSPRPAHPYECVGQQPLSWAVTNSGDLISSNTAPTRMLPPLKRGDVVSDSLARWSLP